MRRDCLDSEKRRSMKHKHFYSRLFVYLFFAGFLLIGLNIVHDYGLGFDDEIQERHGRVSFDYVNKTLGISKGPIAPNKEQLHEYEYKYYGVIFQLSSLYIERSFGLKTYFERYMLRHHLVFLLFFFACICFYRILYRHCANRYLALLGTLIFILAPRTFAHAFFNIKDAVLLAFFVFGLSSFFRYLDDPKWQNALLHAFVCGLTVNIRIVGIILPALTVGWIVLYGLSATDKKAFFQQWKKGLALFAVSTPVFIYIFWPYLWEAPLHNFVESFKAMGKFDWRGEVLLFNEYLYAPELPWYYAPAWMLISIPLFYWLLFVIGFGKPLMRWIKDLFKGNLNWLKDREQRFIAIALSFFLMPLLMVIIKQSTLYDGWRQLHFTYAGFALVAFAGLVRLFRWSMVKGRRTFNLVKIITGVNLGYLLVLMVYIHPYQQTYFNVLATGDQFSRFELDYWGISYRSGLKQLAELAEEGECIKFYSFSYPGIANHKFLDEETKEKLCLGYSPNDSDYYITNFRSKEERRDYKAKNGRFDNPVVLIERLGEPIMGVFKLDKK